MLFAYDLSSLKKTKKFVNDPGETDPCVNRIANVTSISQHNLRVISFVNRGNAHDASIPLS